MAAEVLENISEDRRAWVQYYHKLKNENDRESQILYARSEGLKEGIKEGKLEATFNIIKELKTTVKKAMEITKLPDDRYDQLIDELKKHGIQYTP